MMELKMASADLITSEQDSKLKTIGFEFEDKPTITLALKWIRDNFGIFHCMTDRHMQKNDIRFSVWNSSLRLNDCGPLDLSRGRYDETDGVIDSYEETESSALDYALNFLIKINKLEGGYEYYEEAWNNDYKEYFKKNREKLKNK